MKKITKLMLLTFCLFITSSITACKSSSAQLNRSITVSQNATNYFFSRDDSAFYLLLDSNLKNRITLEDLSSQLDDIIRVYGSVKEINTEEFITVNDTQISSTVKIPVRFTSGWMDFQYDVNEAGSITNFKIVTSKMLDESGYNEILGSYKLANYSESYVYTQPNSSSEDTPLIILIHDKDAYDRNSTVGVTRFFRSLAYQLADNKISSIRYDRILLDNNEEDSLDLIIQELESLISTLKSKNIITNQPIFLFGYGVGGYLMPYIAQHISADGYIICNAPATSLSNCFYQEEVYLIDVDYSLSQSRKNERLKEIEATKNIIDTLSSPDDYLYKLFGYTSSFWLSIKNYNPLVMAKQITKPVLILAGSNDYKVGVNEYNTWENDLSSLDNFIFKFYKDTDHMMVKRLEPSGPKDALIGGSLSSAFVKDLSSFILNN